MSNIPAVTAIADSVFASTKKNFVSFKAIQELLPANIGPVDYRELGYKWQTLVISEHGFLAEYKAKYKREAKKNIPKIYYGKGGFENYEMGGGCCYVLVRK